MNEDRLLIYLTALLWDVGGMRPSVNPAQARETFLRNHLAKIGIAKVHVESILRLVDSPMIQRAIQMVSEKGTLSRVGHPSLLRSIFPSLSLEKKPSTARYSYLPTALSLNEQGSSNIFAEMQSSGENPAQEEYERIWDEFCNEHNQLKDSHSLTAYTSSLFALLAKYATRISPTLTYPTGDVSLYDHSRLVAAATNCLSLEGQSLTDPQFVFLIGDLSGLQKFIYSNIDPSEAGASEGLAKRLRGRSYYISLLTDVIAERLTEVFEVNEANILYAGGGGFQLLLPKTVDYEERIATFTKETNQHLFEKIGGRIGLVTGYTVADQTIFQQSSAFIQRAYDHIGEQKARKFESNLDYLFFERPKLGESQFKDDEELGEVIPYGRLILEVEAKGLRVQQEELLKPQASLSAFDRYFFILDERKKRSDIDFDLAKIINAYRDQARSFRLLSINDTDFLDRPAAIMQQFQEVDIRAGFRFIGSYAPTRTNNRTQEVIMFEQLAKKNNVDGIGNEELSYPKLAVMRLDVDNLGALFALGLGEQASFARVATLSRELHLFFSGYFNQIARKYQLYVTYSGGDDAFVVGSWLNVMHAAKELRRDFQRFTCDNTELSFSAGIFMCSEYYPVAKFAHQAENAEDKAKQFNKGAKDAVCVFDHTLSWSQYFEMLDFAETIMKYVEATGEEKKGKLSRSLIHRILQVVNACISEDGQLIPRRLYQQTARLHYLFARQTRKEGSSGFNHEFIEKTKTKFATGGEEMEGSLDEQIAQHVIRIFLDHFSHNGDKKGLVANLIVPTSYVTYKTRTLDN